MTTKDLIGIAKATAVRWNDHNAPRLGAALAYYALLSVAPLMILAVAISGIIFGKESAQQQLLDQTSRVLGQGGTATLKMLINNAHKPGTGIFASSVAVITLFFGASRIFMELRDDLNCIWDAPAQPSLNWRTIVWQRLVSFGMVLALGVLLLASLILSTAFAVIEKFFTGLLPMNTAILGEVLNFVISVTAIALLFAITFKFVPDVPIDWRDVSVGAIVSAILFLIGKSLLAVYLNTAAVGSTYGAAGSLVAFIVWVYYSAQIFLFGAIFTRVYADKFGSHAKRKATAAAPDESLETPKAKPHAAS